MYGTELMLVISENTEAKFIYNVVAAWMGQDPGLIKLQICKTEPLKEGMGHVLEANDHLWDEIYNFSQLKATIRKKKFDILNLKFQPEENVNVVINLKTVMKYLSVNRFLKLSSLKKIVRERFLKEYEKSAVFEDEVALPYPDEMKVEMFCGNQIQGYLLDKRILSVKINYKGGVSRFRQLIIRQLKS
jgi:hypothetical protein